LAIWHFSDLSGWAEANTLTEGNPMNTRGLSDRCAEPQVLPKLGEPIRYSLELKANLSELIASAKSAGLEGLVAKRRNSRYEPGLRSGAWQKTRINRGQEFVIGGYTPSDRNFDAMIFGYYKDGKLQYVARTRNGFTPSSREQLFNKLKPLEVKECPFANLPEARSGRWGVCQRFSPRKNP
jgi:ATP-dependent DNA ligase